MKQFDLDKPNIFMKLMFVDEETNNKELTFLYSDSNGMKHLETVLEQNPLFSNLLSPTEVLTKMSYEIAGLFASNQFTGVESCGWIGKFVKAFSNEEPYFNTEFNKWKNQLEAFLGKENIFEVKIPANEFDTYYESIINSGIHRHEQSIHIFKFVETYRLNLELRNDLNINDNPNRKHKL
jgi:hypothetical protein